MATLDSADRKRNEYSFQLTTYGMSNNLATRINGFVRAFVTSNLTSIFRVGLEAGKDSLFLTGLCELNFLALEGAHCMYTISTLWKKVEEIPRIQCISSMMCYTL